MEWNLSATISGEIPFCFISAVFFDGLSSIGFCSFCFSSITGVSITISDSLAGDSFIFSKSIVSLFS
ncbi:MAG TPA: hypothetical protein DCG75_11915 [Bacteroidales bacterium]|nr:hypothetical protein [Bacteroidales bacterium]